MKKSNQERQKARSIAQERKKARQIARAWKKGKISSAEDLLQRVERELPELWAKDSKWVMGELDRVYAAQGKWKKRLSAAALTLGRLVVAVVVIAAIAFVVAVSAFELLGQKEPDGQATVVATQSVAAAPPLTPTLQALPTPTAASSLTPTPEPSPDTPTPKPQPALAISGVVTTTRAGQVNLGEVQLTLFSSKSGEQDWASGETVRPGESGGAFTLQTLAGAEPCYYRLQISAPSGAYVEKIEPLAGWQDTIDELTGLISGLQSQVTITEANLTGIIIALAAVPTPPQEPITGTYHQGYTRRIAPYVNSPESQAGDVPDQVTVWGQYSDWRLACCQEITSSSDDITTPPPSDVQQEYFWSGYDTATQAYVVALPDEQASSSLPGIYLPSGMTDFDSPPPGWASETTDGLTILSSRGITVTQPGTLEWQIDELQGWFHLEAWVPSGSEAAVYRVFVLDDNGQENPLEPLAGAQSVAAVPGTQIGWFQSIGAYRLAAESTIIVRLPHPGQKGVKAAFIRVIWP